MKKVWALFPDICPLAKYFTYYFRGATEAPDSCLGCNCLSALPGALVSFQGLIDRNFLLIKPLHLQKTDASW